MEETIDINKVYYDRPYYDILALEGARMIPIPRTRKLTLIEQKVDDKMSTRTDTDPRPDVFIKSGHKMRVIPDNLYEEYLGVVLAAVNFVEAADEHLSNSGEVYKAEMDLRNALEAAGYEL